MHALHPGGVEVGPLRVDSLAVRCVDEARAPLVPATWLDRLRVLWDGALAATVPDPPAFGNAIGVLLGPRTIEPGDTAVVTIVLDFELTAPAGTFELTLGASGVRASDHHTGRPAAPVPEPPAEFPFGSGLGRIVSPSRTLEVAFESLLPAFLASDGGSIGAARVILTNTATPGSSDILVDHLTLRGAGASGASVPLGAAIQRVIALRDGVPWAASATLGPDSLTATLVPGSPLAVPPGAPVALEIQLAPQAAPALESFRVGLDRADVGVVQPENPLLTVAVQAGPGLGFPFWSEAARFSARALGESYLNWPNPFAAGHAATSFSFYLPEPARVTLRSRMRASKTRRRLRSKAFKFINPPTL